jgi:hypothetical protein
MSGGFDVNLSFSGQVVVLKKIFFLFLHFFFWCDNLPSEDDLALYLNNFAFPLHKDALYQIWLKLTSLFWRRFLKIFSVFFFFFTCLQLSPLGERDCRSFEQFWFPFTYGWFVTTLIEICPAVLEKKSKMQVLQTDGWTDSRQIKGDQKSSLELSAQMS